MKRRDFLAQAGLGVGLNVGLWALGQDRAWSQSRDRVDPRVDPLVLHVTNRLSFGPGPGELANVSQMGVDRYIESQLELSTVPLPDRLNAQLAQFPTLQENTGQLVEEYRNSAASPTATEAERAAKVKIRQERMRAIVKEAQRGRLLRAVASPRQLEEVLTDFWYNHFNVFSGKGSNAYWVGTYERDAIRPHVLGKFRDMLGATAKHPAMLFYLDNWQSTKQGLNENYARELMELHTLGVNGGYSQSDVQDLARVFTGWTLTPRGRANESGFFFYPSRNDETIVTFLRKTLKKTGVEKGEEVLDILAAHPSTAKFISRKLAQYFVRDNPPASLVAKMQRRFQQTQGDLREVLRTLFYSEEFRDPKVYRGKYKTPYRYVVSAVRATGLSLENADPLISILLQSSMPIYGCPTPDGYKQVASAWINATGMDQRLNFAVRLGQGRYGLVPNPKPIGVEALEDTIAIQLKAATLKQIQSQPAYLRSALMLGSPEFMNH